MDDEGESVYVLENLIWNTVDRNTSESIPRTEIGRGSAKSELTLALRRLEERTAQPVTSIASFMAAVAVINPPFKPRTLHRPWSISAGQGSHGSVEVHRYVPGRNFNVFNDISPLKLRAYRPFMKKTGEYYAVKRLMRLMPPDEDTTRPVSRLNTFALLADELRILAHEDLRGHPNIVYLFGVSHMPPRSGYALAEPNLVLQEGDCGDLYSFYREADLRVRRQTLVEVKMSLCFDIACGLEALHLHGVVHCDLKPRNILIRRRHGRSRPIHSCKNVMEAGQVAIEALTGQGPFVAMLADFGGSVILSDSTSDTVRPKIWTPLWCAPECYSDTPISKTLLSRIDIYSAGLIFAFILLEGRDIFTQVVDRGRMHQYDIPMSPEVVRGLKLSGAAMALAKEAVQDFETARFGITADDRRIYLMRNQMYPLVLSNIFHDILELALQVDPLRRVEGATDLLEPWVRALQGNFHVDNLLDYSQPELFRSFASGRLEGSDHFKAAKVCARSQGPCTAVPRAFPDANAELIPGVFDIRQSFKIFRASLTSGLKTEIFNDLLQEVELLQSIEQHILPPMRLQDVVSAAQLRRAAGSGYQIAVACMEGFGRARNDRDALKWMKISAEWGCTSAQADYIALSGALGVQDGDWNLLAQDDNITQWALTAVADHGKQSAANFLWRSSKTVCDAAITKYLAENMMRLLATFNQQTGLDCHALFRGRDQEILRLYFAESGVDQSIGLQNGWCILHYAALAGPLEDIKFLVENLGAEVRSLSLMSETALDVAMAWGSVDVVDYLLERHELCHPPFWPGSCPLQNVSSLPAYLIPDVVYRMLSMPHALDIDTRSQDTGRTALMNTLLTKHPLFPDARQAAINTLLLYGANPLLTTIEPGTVSPLLLAVIEVDDGLVAEMLNAIAEHEHTTPLVDVTRARPEPANELARAFFLLMQTPRSVTLTRAGRNYGQAYKHIIKMMMEWDISVELPYLCRSLEHDALGLACYYGKDEAMHGIVEVSGSSGTAVSETLNSLSGINAIHGAINCGFSEVVDFLLPLMMSRQDVADYNLLVSAMHHQPAMVPQVYSHFERAGKGPDILSYVDPWGATAFDLAMEYGYLDLARFLAGKGATYDVYRLKGDHSIDDGEQSTLASVLPRMEPVQFLMELNPRPSLIVTSTGLNVFHILASDEKLIGNTVGRGEFLGALEYFYRMDPSLIHAKGGSQGLTPFHIVSLHYSEIIGGFLYERGADINAVSTVGHTPLDLLHFHAEGDRPHDQRLTIDYEGDTPRSGVAICDYALAGPAYWVREAKLNVRLQSLYSDWGAKRSAELGEGQMVERLSGLRIS
ncbi:serine/threonine protein kinase [Ilyonectria robusta]